MQSSILSLYLPAPVFWGVLAAWIPVPPAVMVGILCGAMVYALCNYLLGLREWVIDERQIAEAEEMGLLEFAR